PTLSPAFTPSPLALRYLHLSLPDALPICPIASVAGAARHLHLAPEDVDVRAIRRGRDGELRAEHGDLRVRGPDRQLRPFRARPLDRKSTRLNSSHVKISYAVFCLKKKIPT